MTLFDVPGARLSIARTGDDGRAVVALHGLTSSRARDRAVGADPTAGLSGVRLLRYDARGHGFSGGRAEPADYRWPNLAADLRRVLDHFFPGEQVHGVGTSMGCATLLHAAVADPNRFRGLTLALPPTAWETRVGQRGALLANAQFVQQHGIDAYLELGRGAAGPPAAAGRPDPHLEVLEELLPSVLRGAADSDLPDPAQLARLQLPVRLLAWVDDPSHPLSTARRLAELLPQAELTVAATPDDVAAWPTLVAADVSAAESPDLRPAGH